MSKQLAVSSALSIFLMAAYVLLGTDAQRAPLATGLDADGFANAIEISAPELPQAGVLLPTVR